MKAILERFRQLEIKQQKLKENDKPLIANIEKKYEEIVKDLTKLGIVLQDIKGTENHEEIKIIVQTISNMLKLHETLKSNLVGVEIRLKRIGTRI